MHSGASHQDVVARRRKHVLEIGHLQVAASHRRVEDERDIARRQVANQRLSDRQCAVVRVVDAEHHLDDRVILLGKRSQIFV